MLVKSENKMGSKQCSMLWAGRKNNQRSKDVIQDTYVKKILDASQANLVNNNENEYTVLLSNLKNRRGRAYRTDALDSMQCCTCVNNAQMSTGDNIIILGSQNNNNDEVQTMRNPTSIRQRVAMNLGAF